MVGGVCGIILLLGLAWWFLRNRKKTKKHDQDQEDAQLSDDGSQGRRPGFNKQKAPRELDPGQGALPVKELEDNPVGEMDAGQDAMRAEELEDPKGGVVRVLPELDDQRRSSAVELPS